MICVSGYDVCLLWMGGGATVYCLRWLSFCFFFFFLCFFKEIFSPLCKFCFAKIVLFRRLEIGQKRKRKAKMWCTPIAICVVPGCCD